MKKLFLFSKRNLLTGACMALFALAACSPDNNPINPTPTPPLTKDTTTNGNNVISGTCGQSLTWTFDATTATLSIQGVGAMYDYPNFITSPPSAWQTFSIKSKHVQIGDSVTSIGDYAFYYCFNLTSITIGNGVISIGKGAFTDCFNLPSISIPNSVTSIGRNAFENCSNLSSVILSNSMTSIENFTFDYCSALTSVTIPNGITSIGESVFLYCTALTSITIPSSVTNIKNSFDYCTNLTSITCLNPTPPIADVFSFWAVPTNTCTLKVPAASVTLYQQAPVWSSFTNIVGM